MNREEVYSEMTAMLGSVPAFFGAVPDDQIGDQWAQFKSSLMAETAIPGKYKRLLAVGLSAVNECAYCYFFNVELARMLGATDAEIEDAVKTAQGSAGWSAFFTATQPDLEQFKSDVRKVCTHVSQHMAGMG